MVLYAMSLQDTICAVSTPPGEGGIGIIRISGPDAVVIAAKVFRPKRGDLAATVSHTIRYGHVADPGTGEIVDEALASVMRGPATYTREDVVEINCHGGSVPLWRTMRLLLRAGARQAEPGEFTKRAFLNGRIDLSQAEAVMDVIRSRTELSHRAAQEQLRGGLSREVAAIRERLIGVTAAVEAAVDFPEEDLETPEGRPLEEELAAIGAAIGRMLEGARFGRLIREGYAAAIAGRPNVGKSSLLNALVRQDRAIVTEMPGTTRDVLEEYLNIGGLPLKILDTAGIRHTADLIEQEGVRRSLGAVSSADIVLLVLDGSQELTSEDRYALAHAAGKTTIAVINKKDLPRRLERPAWPETQVEVSCRTGGGLDELRKAVLEKMRAGAVPPREHAWAVSERHREALEQALQAVERGRGSARSARSPELIAVDLRDGLDHLGAITGATHTEDILERIFRDFCIGK
jgi:tRNA modification GTPase